MYKISHAFVYERHLKQLGEKNYCGALIDNRKSSPICVLDENERESKQNLKNLEKSFVVSVLCNLST